VSVLVELTKVEGTAHGSLIAAQMLDVAVRVQSIRHLAVQQMALLIQVRAQLLCVHKWWCRMQIFYCVAVNNIVVTSAKCSPLPRSFVVNMQSESGTIKRV
jgi:hypothetical protein